MKASPFRRREPIDPAGQADLVRLSPPPGDPELPLERHLLLKEHLLSEIQREVQPSVRETGSSFGPESASVRASHRPRRRFLVPVGALTAAAALAVTLYLLLIWMPEMTAVIHAFDYKPSLTKLGQERQQKTLQGRHVSRRA